MEIINYSLRSKTIIKVMSYTKTKTTQLVRYIHFNAFFVRLNIKSYKTNMKKIKAAHLSNYV